MKDMVYMKHITQMVNYKTLGERNGEMVGIWKTFSRDGFLLSEKKY